MGSREKNVEELDFFTASQLVVKLTEENRSLKKEVRELQDRLRWIRSLTKGLIENDLLREIQQGR